MATPSGLPTGAAEPPDTSVTGYGAAPEGSAKEQRTMDRIVQGAHGAVDRLAEKASPAVEKLRSGYADASGVLHEKADKLSEMQDQMLIDARDKVRAHPLAAVGAALAIGLLIGRLVR